MSMMSPTHVGKTLVQLKQAVSRTELVVASLIIGLVIVIACMVSHLLPSIAQGMGL